MIVNAQQNRRPSDPLSDGEAGLVNARSRLCFGFIKLVLVLEHLNIDTGRPSPVASHPCPYPDLISDNSKHCSVLIYYSRFTEFLTI